MSIPAIPRHDQFSNNASRFYFVLQNVALNQFAQETPASQDKISGKIKRVKVQLKFELAVFEQ